MFNSMIMEASYRGKQKEALKDENGEYEWIEVERFDGVEKVKKYKDPQVI